MDSSSGVGVLDKAALVLTALESGPATLAGLVAGTGLARPTAHRLAVALEHHRLVARDMQGRFVLGPRLAELSAAAGEDRLVEDSRLVGMFRAHGLLTPVWDLPLGTGAEVLEEPAARFAADLAEALEGGDLTPAERSARAGLANRQVTIR